MLQRILAILLLFVVADQVSAQPVIYIYIGNQPYGKSGSSIESIEEQHELMLKDVTVEPIRIVMRFNQRGYITNELKYGKMGGLQSETRWEYDAKMQILKKTHNYFINYAGWKLDETILIYNDTTGYLSDIKQFRDGNLTSFAKVTCDSIGRPVEVRIFDSRGVYVNIERVIYIASANAIKVMNYKSTNQFINSWTYPLDNSKPFINSSIRKEYYPNGEVMIEMLDTGNTDQGYFYEYIYDSRGNWTVKQTYQVNVGKNMRIRNKKLEHSIKRTITYY